jgi:hypothetical protein
MSLGLIHHQEPLLAGRAIWSTSLWSLGQGSFERLEFMLVTLGKCDRIITRVLLAAETGSCMGIGLNSEYHAREESTKGSHLNCDNSVACSHEE